MDTSADFFTQLLVQQFGVLSAAEKRLVDVSISDEDTDWFVADPELVVAQASTWSSDAEVRAALIRWMCTNAEARARIGRQGICLSYARIRGRLNLARLHCEFPLTLRHCFIPGGVYAPYSQFGFIDLRASHTQDFVARKLVTKASLWLGDGLKVADGIRLEGASIGGSVYLDGSEVTGRNKPAINLEYTRITDSLVMRRGFRAVGPVRLFGTSVGVSIDMESGTFIGNRSERSIELTHVQIGGDLRMWDGFRAIGQVSIIGCKIDGSIICDGGRFAARKTFALLIDSSRIGGLICVRRIGPGREFARCRVYGGLRIYTSSAGSLELTGARLTAGRRRLALELISVKVSGWVLCNRGFNSFGLVNVFASTIGGALDLTDARLCGLGGGRALDLMHTTIEAGVILGGRFRAFGQTRIYGGAIRGGVESIGGRLAARGAPALLIESTTITGPVLLRGSRDGQSRPFRALGGVRLYGTSISGDVDIAGAILRAAKGRAWDVSSVRIVGSVISTLAYIKGATIFLRVSVGGGMDFRRAICIRPHGPAALEVVEASIGGALLLGGGFRAIGTVRVAGCTAGSIECHGGRFAARRAYGLIISGVTIQRQITLNRLEQDGKVRASRVLGGVAIAGCAVGGDVVLSGAFLVARNEALRIVGSRIGGSVYMNSGFRARGAVTIFGTKIQVALVGSGHFLQQSGGPAISLVNSQIEGAIMFTPDFIVRGQVYVYGCSIAGSIELGDAQIIALAGSALWMLRVKIAGALNFGHGFRAVGQVSFDGGTVGAGVFSHGGRFAARGKHGLALSGVKIQGNVVLQRTSAAADARYFRSLGGVRLHNCSIEGDLSMRGAILLAAVGDEQDALDAPRLRVQGSVFLSTGFRTRGAIDLKYSVVENQLDLRGASLRSRKSALALSGARIGGAALLRDCDMRGELDLTGASISRLEDDEASWPGTGQLRIHGLVYQTIMSHDSTLRLRWLALQAGLAPSAADETAASSRDGKKRSASRQDFIAQPYEQLVQVLRKLGHEHDARKIAIGKERVIRRSGALRLPARILNLVYGATMRYGYRPQFSLWYAPIFVLGLTFAYHHGAEELMVPTKDAALAQWKASRTVPTGYPAFSPLAYSIDTFIPILNLRQRDSWQVDDHSTCTSGPENCGQGLRNYLWVHSIFGWLISTMTLAGLAGLVRKS